jgi:hypothetical protein
VVGVLGVVGTGIILPDPDSVTYRVPVYSIFILKSFCSNPFKAYCAQLLKLVIFHLFTSPSFTVRTGSGFKRTREPESHEEKIISNLQQCVTD